jgi:hypothetical protein
VETITGHQISLIGSHYIRVHYLGYLAAWQLTSNHSLYVADIGAVRIRSIKMELKLGVYNPITSSGTLLVNNILASSYSKNKLKGTHYVKHRIFAPYRWWYYVAKYWFGFHEVYTTPSHGENQSLKTLVHTYGHIIHLIYQIIQTLSIIMLFGMMIRFVIYVKTLKDTSFLRWRN